MAYAEKRNGKLTGQWVGGRDRRKRCGVCFKRAFASKHEAENEHHRSP
jgi:hypothetical protein